MCETPRGQTDCAAHLGDREARHPPGCALLSEAWGDAAGSFQSQTTGPQSDERAWGKEGPNASCSEPSFHQAHILWNGLWTQSQRCLLQECQPAHLPEEEVEAGEAWKLTKATGGQVQTGG